MLKLFRTKTFQKDYKKQKISDQHYSKYLQYLSSLIKEETLPEEALDHPLKGEYKSFREFHISGDLLIIYIIQEDTLKLVRIGTHSQLFE